MSTTQSQRLRPISQFHTFFQFLIPNDQAPLRLRVGCGVWGVGKKRAANNRRVTSPVLQDDCLTAGFQAPSMCRLPLHPTPYPLHPIADTPYFNSGVLVINLTRWRKENVGDRVIEYLRKYQPYVQLEDQEGLNAVLANDWGKLDPKWNLISHIYYFDQWQESAFKEEGK